MLLDGIRSLGLAWCLERLPLIRMQLSPVKQKVTGFTLSGALTHESGCKKSWRIATQTARRQTCLLLGCRLFDYITFSPLGSMFMLSRSNLSWVLVMINRKILRVQANREFLYEVFYPYLLKVKGLKELLDSCCNIAWVLQVPGCIQLT